MNNNETPEVLLTISILISNNYDNVKRCLESVKPLLDNIESELILTDTGVDKRLRMLLEQYTSNIIDFKWCQDFSAARNVGLKAARGQWFLYIDDDEWFENTAPIVDFIKSDMAEKYNVACYTQRNYLEKTGQRYSDNIVDRILRINPKLHFEHRVHEAYTDIEIKEKKVLAVIAHHYGYCYNSEKEMLDKHLRNQNLLEIECTENPDDMRMRYQMVINPYTIQDWDMSIKLANEAIKVERDSEYWDACHTSILYCLEKKGDWETLIQIGNSFLKKPLCPYDRFGTMQFMIDAYWNCGQLKEICDMAEEALNLYQAYSENPAIFNRNQLMRTTFVEKDYMLYFLMYSITAGLSLGSDSLINKLTTGATSEMVDKILNTPDLKTWINSHIYKEARGVQIDRRLEFEPVFFEGEERNGFVVEPMMKNAWAASLYVLNIIDRICEKHDIKYFADWGTLLGAVRHRGYIPWDDDIDICMIRGEYDRFREIVTLYEDEISLLNNYTVDNWGEKADRVVNNTAFMIKRHDIKKYYGFPFPAGVDIFVLDYVPRDKNLETEQIVALRTISQLVYLRNEMEIQDSTDEEYELNSQKERQLVKEIQTMTNVQFMQENPTNQELLILRDEVSGLYSENDADYVTQMQLLGVGRDYYVPKNVYENTTRILFENIMIPVPTEYSFILEKKYGEDYMTPKNIGSGHDYPFYNKLFEAVQENNPFRTVEDLKDEIVAASSGFYRKFVQQSTKPRVTYNTVIVADSEDMEKRQIRMAESEVIAEISRICANHNWNVYGIITNREGILSQGEYGENDEIHLGMFRKDYVEFLTCLPAELDSWFDYRDLYHYDNHEELKAYIITDNYMTDIEDYMKRFHGCPHIVGVDITPIDAVFDDTQREEVRQMLLSNLIFTAHNMPDKPPYNNEVSEIVNEWCDLAKVKVDKNKNLRNEFMKSADMIASSCKDENSAYVKLFDNDTRYKRKHFEKTQEVLFGNMKVMIPIG